MSGGHYALGVVYDASFLDETVGIVRRTMTFMALLAMFLGGAIFYLVGGRSLLRSHRLALSRATRDGLTDMANQRAFQDDIEQAVSSAARHDRDRDRAIRVHAAKR